MALKNIRKPFWKNLTLISGASAESATAVLDRTRFSGTGTGYHKISAREAKDIIDSGEAVTLLDVREPFEYKSGHIRSAKSLPVGSVAEKAPGLLPERNAKILVYCLSGGRSRAAANLLVRLGYTRVYDFGGIADWPYEVAIE